MKTKLLNSRNLLLFMVVLAGPIFLFNTNPSHLPLPLLLLPFLWLFVVLFGASYFIVGNRDKPGTKRRRVAISGVIAGLPVLLLVFDSIHQLTIRDILVVVSLLVMTSFYLLKADFID